MRNLFFFLLLLAGINGISQRTNNTSLVLGILQPDTAMLEGPLQSEVEIVEQDQQDKYNSAIRQMETVMNLKDYSRENEKQMSRTREEIRKALPALKEKNTKNFRYYHLLSSSLGEACTAQFGKNPLIRIEQYNLQASEITTLNEIAGKMNCDYIIFFSDIHGLSTDNSPVLKLTTSVYSKKDNAVIFSQPSEVCCDKDKNKEVLSSLLQDAAVSSLDQIVALIKEIR
ncbi:MAG: hypothetical protein WDO19_26610 [Bacteroidota bacterium]